MAVNKTVSLDVVADISRYQSQFAKVPGFTDKMAARAATNMVKRLQRAQDQAARDAKSAAARAAREWEKTANQPSKFAGSLKNVSDKAGEVDSVLSGVGGALDAIDPKLGAVARAFGDAAGGMEAVSRAGMLSIPVLGAVAVAAAALGGAYLLFSHNLEQAEKRLKASAAIAGKVAKGYGLFQAAIESTDAELQKLTGTYDKEGAAQEERDKAINRGADQLVFATQLKINEIERERKALLEKQRVDETTEAKLAELARRTALYEESIRDVNRQRDEALEKSADIAFGQQAEAEAARAAASATRDKAAADASAGKAAAAREAEERRLAEQLAAVIHAGEMANRQADRTIAIRKEVQAQLVQEDKLRRQNLHLIREASGAELTAEEQARIAGQRRLESAQAIFDQRMENAKGNREIELQAQREYLEARQSIQIEYDRRLNQIQQQQATRAVDFAQFAAGTAATSAQTVSEILRERGQGKRAQAAFKAAKTLNAALVTMETIRAARGALLPPPVGYGAVLGPAAAAVIGASGAVQVAAIKSQKMPKFYRGTENVRGDEVPAVLHRGEAVLNRSAAERMGRDNIRRQNEGVGDSASPGHVVAISTLKHRQFREFYRDDRSLPGSLTRRDRSVGARIGRQLT